MGSLLVEQLLDNIKALEITLFEEQIRYLAEQSPFNFGFLYSMVGTDQRQT
jgi:aryl-alcohol dehydrogenase-like predicted oxidoreductase